MVDVGAIEEIRARIGEAGAVRDGPVCLRRYLAAPRRIVWVLREADDDTSTLDDLSDFLCNKLFGYRRWHVTWGAVAKVSQAILRNPWPDSLPPGSAREAADAIRDVAVVNVKKAAGKSRVNWRNLREEAAAFSDVLERQIAALNPAIIIAAGTTEFLTGPLLEAASSLAAKPFDAVAAGGRWLVKTYHTGQRRMTHASFYSAIRNSMAEAGYSNACTRVPAIL